MPPFFLVNSIKIPSRCAPTFPSSKLAGGTAGAAFIVAEAREEPGDADMFTLVGHQTIWNFTVVSHIFSRICLANSNYCGIKTKTTKHIKHVNCLISWQKLIL